MIKQNRLEYFDLARAVAVIGVMAVHAAQVTGKSIVPISLWELGRFGVQLFFLISGATVALTYSKIQNNYSKPIRVFLIRRFFRIVPLFMLMGMYYSYQKNINIFAVLSPMSLVNPHTINSIAGGWSIWNELFFYLLFPVYFKIREKSAKVFVFYCLMIIFSVAVNFRFWTFTDSFEWTTYDYENFATQLVPFILGVEYILGNKNRVLLVFSFFIPSIIIKSLWFPESLMVAGYGANYYLVLISLIGILVINIFKKLTPLFMDGMTKRLLLTIGRMTYTLYMIHFVIIEVFRPFMEVSYAELNILVISIISVVISKLIQPYTEIVFSNFGYKITDKYKL